MVSNEFAMKFKKLIEVKSCWLTLRRSTWERCTLNDVAIDKNIARTFIELNRIFILIKESIFCA